jgi:hypothetical protein
METQHKKQYCYTTRLHPDGTKKGVYLGKTSSPEGKKHQQKMEEKRMRKEREHELAQLQQAVHQALPLSGMICAHCFSDDTELLTKDGWRGIDEVAVGDSIATLNKDTGAIEYQPAINKWEYDYVGDMYHMKSHAADHLVTPNHVMLYESYGTWKEKTAEEFFITGAKIPVSGVRLQDDLPLYDNDDELRFHVWAACDGSFRGPGVWRFHFKKERKIERLIALVERLGYAYEVARSQDEERVYIKVWGVPEKITKRFGECHRQLSPRQTTILLIEWSHTDGSYASSRTEEHFQLSTNVPFHRDLIQELCAVSGHKSTCAISEKDGHPDVFMLHIRLNVNRVKSDVINRGVVEYAGRVWCLETTNHTLIARRNGKVCITSNSNEKEWDEFRNNKTNEAFIDRIYLVRVPYCLRLDEEVHIYEKLLRESDLHSAPCANETLRILATWSLATRYVEPQNSNIWSKMKVYNGEIIKDTDPQAKSYIEYRTTAGILEGMSGMSTRFAFKILSRTFSADPEEVAANPVHLMSVLMTAIDQENLPQELADKFKNYIREKIQQDYVKKLEKQLQQAYLESYGDYGQNMFERYFMYADAWIQDSDFRDPDTHQMWDRDQLNNECEKIEKAAGIANPKDFRNEIVNYVLRYRAKNNGASPKWTA